MRSVKLEDNDSTRLNNISPANITELDYRKYVTQLASYVESENATVHSVVDNAKWIIYNGYPNMILLHSRNHNAYFDAMGDDLPYNETSKIMQLLAFYALESDIREVINY